MRPGWNKVHAKLPRRICDVCVAHWPEHKHDQARCWTKYGSPGHSMVPGIDGEWHFVFNGIQESCAPAIPGHPTRTVLCHAWFGDLPLESRTFSVTRLLEVRAAELAADAPGPTNIYYSYVAADGKDMISMTRARYYDRYGVRRGGSVTLEPRFFWVWVLDSYPGPADA